MKDNLLCITPIKNYNAPRIPTWESKQNDLALLKKLPLRWRKNAIAITSIGIIGMMALSGCSQHRQQEQVDPVQGVNINISPAHNGGAPSMPFYAVYLTEQEALGIIRSQLESYELNFISHPLGYTITVDGRSINLDLIDEDNGIAVVYICRRGHAPPTDRSRAMAIANGFMEQYGITVGVFYNPGDQITSLEFSELSDEGILDRMLEAKPALEANLTEQVQEFIASLHEKGMI